jgi:hypothetical protein
VAVNTELALQKIQEFVALLNDAETNRLQAYRSDTITTHGGYNAAKARVHVALPLIEGIAEDIDPDLRQRITHGINYGSGYSSAIAAIQELAGNLMSQAELAERLKTVGPTQPEAKMRARVGVESARA